MAVVSFKQRVKNEAKTKMKNVDLVFRKPRSSKEVYSELVLGNVSSFFKYKDNIKGLVSKKFIK